MRLICARHHVPLNVFGFYCARGLCVKGFAPQPIWDEWQSQRVISRVCLLWLQINDCDALIWDLSRCARQMLIHTHSSDMMPYVLSHRNPSCYTCTYIGNEQTQSTISAYIYSRNLFITHADFQFSKKQIIQQTRYIVNLCGKNYQILVKFVFC